MIKVGVLELQGNFSMHHKILQNIGIKSVAVKKSSQLIGIDGLVIPGGESTTMSLLIQTFNMYESLVDFGQSHPVLGTCAGLILMSKTTDDKRIKPLGLVDIHIQRNAYGRQIESRTEKIKFNFSNQYQLVLPATIIRAPIIKEMNRNLKVIGIYDNKPIAILSGHHLCLSFHPELNGINIFHRVLFDKECKVYYKNINEHYVA